MINPDQTIPCPVCETKIPFDAKELLGGVKFICPSSSCDATIGLASQSKPIVQDTLEKLESIKS